MRRKRTRRSASGKRSVLRLHVVRRKTGTSILDEFWKPQSCPAPLLTTSSTRWPWGTCYDTSNVTHVRNVITLHGYVSKATIRQSWCGCEIPCSKRTKPTRFQKTGIYFVGISLAFTSVGFEITSKLRFVPIELASELNSDFEEEGGYYVRRSFPALIFIVS